tara:strand:- start:2478 stop:3332 length:855 start_codon:yes stop_codon:yes gene_type:complete
MSERKANANEREIKSYLDIAKRENIPLSQVEAFLIGKQIDPTGFKPIGKPEVQKPEGLGENIQFALGQTNPLLNIDTAKFQEQEFDEKRGVYVGKNRPKGVFRGIAGYADALTGNLTDFDKLGGGFLYTKGPSIAGFGKAAENKELSTSAQKQLEKLYEPEKTALEETDEYKESLKSILGDKELRALRRSIRREEAIDNQLQYIATEPIRQAFANKAAEDAAQRGLRIRAAKEAMPSNIQNIMLSKQAQAATASSAEAERARAVADQQDAATRFASLGMQRRFG